MGFFDELHEWFTEPDYRGCPFINPFAEMRSTSAPITDVAVHQKRALGRHLDGLVRAAGVPPALTSQLLILANGAMATSAMLGSPEAAQEAKAEAEELRWLAAATSFKSRHLGRGRRPARRRVIRQQRGRAQVGTTASAGEPRQRAGRDPAAAACRLHDLEEEPISRLRRIALSGRAALVSLTAAASALAGLSAQAID